MPENWPEAYFREFQAQIESNLEKAIRLDTKKLALAGLADDVVVAQSALWDATNVLNRAHEIYEILHSF